VALLLTSANSHKRNLYEPKPLQRILSPESLMPVPENADAFSPYWTPTHVATAHELAGKLSADTVSRGERERGRKRQERAGKGEMRWCSLHENASSSSFSCSSCSSFLLVLLVPLFLLPFFSFFSLQKHVWIDHELKSIFHQAEGVSCLVFKKKKKSPVPCRLRYSVNDQEV
jgi:hypothetical protein